jgi:hypothetical protein
MEPDCWYTAVYNVGIRGMNDPDWYPECQTISTKLKIPEMFGEFLHTEA